MPSRVRSPTPVNTENPSCPLAMLFISSIISTVLPTPAPPKSPILPPLLYGSSRSMTLMPVASISVPIVRFSNSGAGWCMGRNLERSRVGRLSMASPMTLSSRPLIWSPVGTAMGCPRSSTLTPRCRPSVLSIATQRTVSSPMCCSTSRMSRLPSSRVIASALYMAGMVAPSPSNTTSTTGPITWDILPYCWLITFGGIVYCCFGGI